MNVVAVQEEISRICTNQHDTSDGQVSGVGRLWNNYQQNDYSQFFCSVTSCFHICISFHLNHVSMA